MVYFDAQLSLTSERFLDNAVTPGGCCSCCCSCCCAFNIGEGSSGNSSLNLTPGSGSGSETTGSTDKTKSTDAGAKNATKTEKSSSSGASGSVIDAGKKLLGIE